MAQVYAFVDAPGSSPTTLLNLDNNTPLSVVLATKTSPPPRRVSSFGSSARNGDVVAQKSYPDRTLTISLEFVHGTTAEAQSTAIQSLVRLLDGPGWLKWQHDSKTKPVFFRTKYGDMDVDEDVADATPLRHLTLTITAEPFGYGLPETGSVSIAHDPTAGTNRMTYLMPTILGDVPSPLWFHFTQNAGTWATLLSTSCVPVGSSGGIPVFSGAFDVSGSLTGWTMASSADATAVSGFRKRWTRSSGVLTADVTLTTYLSNVPRGDYRLLVRAQSSVSTATISGWVSDPSLAITASTTTKTIPGTTWGWMDLGVVRAPLGPRKTVLLDQGHASRTYLTFRASITGTGTIDFDELLMIPVGLDDALDTRTAITAGAIAGTDDLYVDGVNEQSYLRIAADDTLAPATVVGGFPRVMPSADCHLNFVRRVDVATDDKSLITAIAWSYYPLYLYDRPTAT